LPPRARTAISDPLHAYSLWVYLPNKSTATVNDAQTYWLTIISMERLDRLRRSLRSVWKQRDAAQHDTRAASDKCNPKERESTVTKNDDVRDDTDPSKEAKEDVDAGRQRRRWPSRGRAAKTRSSSAGVELARKSPTGVALPPITPGTCEATTTELQTSSVPHTEEGGGSGERFKVKLRSRTRSRSRSRKRPCRPKSWVS
jgi:hypothetical protein